MAAVLDGEGLSCGLLLDEPQDRLDAEIRRPGVHIVVAPLDRGGLISSSKLAIVAEPDVTGRRRPHRQARQRPRATEGFFDDLAPGDYVVHNVHGVARFAGMVTRSMGGAERDYLLLEYRGGDRLYLPSEQIDAITPYTGGESPALNRMGGAEWSRQKARVRAAVREVAKELVDLYRRRHTTAGHTLAERARAGLLLPGDPGPAQGDRGREDRHGTARADGSARVW
jgi:transcription-repair coupling factor (superfamily II helicase)